MEFSDYKLQDGDLVEIKKILDEQLNEVSIFGNVYNEGKFSITKVFKSERFNPLWINGC